MDVFANNNEEKPSEGFPSIIPLITEDTKPNDSINQASTGVNADPSVESISQQKPSQKWTYHPITIDDVKKALEVMGITIKLNVISGMAKIINMPSVYSGENAANVLPILLSNYFISNKIKVTKQRIEDALLVIMDENRFNPVWDMLSDTDYDGEDRINVLEEILGITKDSLSCMLLRHWLHQAVAIALNDDEDPYGADGALIIQGEQGEGKTLFFKTIAVYADFFAEGVSIDMNKTDSIIQSTDTWIAELGELDSTLKREQSSLKAFITNRRDKYRLPYAKCQILRPRRTSFCGTVNPEQFLNDETGSRRFWVIHVDCIDVERLKGLTEEWLKKMWRQVYETLYLPNPQGFRLTPEERKSLEARNKSYSKFLPGEIEITDCLNFDQDVTEWVNYRVSSVMNKLQLKGISASQVGKVLAKLAKTDPRIKVTNPQNVKHYLLPRIPDTYN